MSEIIIRKVGTKKDLNKFIMLLWEIYKDDPSWVPPLLGGYRKIFNRKKNPFFLHGEMDFYLAEKDGKVVGRVAPVINHLHNKEHKDNIGFFGFFECIDDQEVANKLLDTARDWLKDKGFTEMRGPASPSSNEDYGCQYTGFEHPPVILTPHNRDYYLKLLTNYGLEEIMDLYAYRFHHDLIIKNKKLNRVNDVLRRRAGVTLREIKKKDFHAELMRFKALYNDAWELNHGFVPLTDKEFEFIAADMKAIVEPSLCLFAEIDGKIVGGTIVLLDYNHIFKQMNGRLFPFNFIKFYTKKKEIKGLRVVTLGVVPEYQKRGIDAILYFEIIKRGIELGCEWAEASFILENNVRMNSAVQNIGGEIYKKYKVLEMRI